MKRTGILQTWLIFFSIAISIALVGCDENVNDAIFDDGNSQNDYANNNNAANNGDDSNNNNDFTNNLNNNNNANNAHGDTDTGDTPIDTGDSPIDTGDAPIDTSGDDTGDPPLPDTDTLAAGQFLITLNQNYTGAPRNMIVTTDAYGTLVGDANAPLVLPSPTRSGHDFRGWFTTSAATGGDRVLSGATGTKFTESTTIYARWTTQTKRTLNDIPAYEKEVFDWVKNVRNECEVVITGSGGSGGNLIFHQLYAGGGSINWAVRWESNNTVTLQQRRQIAGMLYDGINEWIRPLMGYEDFPFGEIPVNVVGWAVQNENLVLDRQPNENIWVNSTNDGPISGYETGFICSAPRERSRFLNYYAINYTSGGHIEYVWPEAIGGRNGRFDMYLWLTQDKEGGNGSAEGGDWGFRWGNHGTNGAAMQAAASHSNNGTIHGTMTHEIGHGYGFYDWYGGPCCGCTQRNPTVYGNQSQSMMHYTYNTGIPERPGVNQFDQWQIRYYYSWVRDKSPANRWEYDPIPWVPYGN